MNRKKAIRNFAVLFVVVLLLLTFFSNTIMNYSLPEVETVPVGSGSVSQKVRCQGSVEVSNDVEITVTGSRKVKEVLVENGDQVTEGQVLITFEEEENSELQNAKETLEEMERNYKKSHMETSTDYTDDELAIKDAEESLAEAKTALEKARADEVALASAQNEVTAVQAQVDAKKQELSNLNVEAGSYPTLESYYEYVAVVETLQEELETAQAELALLTEETAIAVKQAEVDEIAANLAVAQSQVDAMAYVPDIHGRIAQTQADLDALNDQLTEKLTRVSELSAETSVKDAEATVKARQQTLDSLKRTFSQKLEEAALQKQKDEMDEAATVEALQKQRDLVKKLEEKNDFVDVKAKATGLISGITVKAGDEVTAETPLAYIQREDSGFVLTASVTKREADLLRVGNDAEVENVWGSEVYATVRSIRADPSNPNQSAIVKFDIRGDVMSGETLQLAVGEKSGRYDTVVPNNAVKDDADGKYVYVVKVRSTPLGNRYVVKRVKVEVTASDTANSAISGDISEWDNVVTNASKPLDNGQQVRLTEK